MVEAILIVVLAFGLDLWLGEPPTRWHPVGWMGRYLGWAGGLTAPRGPSASPSPDWRAFCCGALAWWVGALVVLAAALALQRLGAQLGSVGIVLIGALLLKPLFAWRMLRDEVRSVDAALSESLEGGRSRLARLVSRDVTHLDEPQVRESAIESLAENLNDSVVAPIFWFVVAGLPGAAIYRFANTADAMWGYRGLRGGADWTWAGKWAARADDVLSWVPARITALLIGLAAGGLALVPLRREAARTASPNSGWPMAAMALALKVRLGKPGAYVLNAEAAAPRAGHTDEAIRVATRAVAMLVAWSCLMLAGIGWVR